MDYREDWPAIIAELRKRYTLTVIAHRVGYADHTAIRRLQRGKGEPVYSKGCALKALLENWDQNPIASA